MLQKICTKTGFELSNYSFFNVLNKVQLQYEYDLLRIGVPDFNITGASKVLTTTPSVSATSSSVYYMSGTTGAQKNITIQFSSDTAEFSATTFDYKVNIYRKIPSSTSFENIPIFTSNLNLSASPFITQLNINESLLKVDSEYILKTNYSYSAKTKSTTKIFSGNNFTNSPIISLSGSDNSFITFRNPVKPYFLIDANLNTVPDGSLVSEVISSITNPQTAFTTTFIPNGDIQVNLNGGLLTKDVDFQINTGATNQFTISGGVYSTDILNVSYIKTSGQTQYRSYKKIIDYSIPSGLTASSTDLVFFNTGSSQYEVRLSAVPILANANLTLFYINGNKLNNGLDYNVDNVSSSVIYLNSGNTIFTNDILNFYYLSTNLLPYVPGDQDYDAGTFTIRNPRVSWRIDKAPESYEQGTFRFDLALFSDTTYSNILNQQYVSYSGGVNDYSVIFNSSGAGINYRMRVINEKTFSATLFTNVITGSSTSQQLFGNTNNTTLFS